MPIENKEVLNARRTEAKNLWTQAYANLQATEMVKQYAQTMYLKALKEERQQWKLFVSLYPPEDSED